MTNVTAVDGKNIDQVAEVVASDDLVTTAVGVGVLKHIAAGIAQGIATRLSTGAKPLHVIACENAIGGSAQLKEHVYALLDEDVKQQAASSIYFPNAAVDRIVPIQHHEDPLHVQVEPFYEWVVDRSQMHPEFKPVDGVLYVDNLEPYIERKLFTVNTGHCSAAYLGYTAGFKTIQEAMADERIAADVRGTLQETGAVLVNRFGFNEDEHERYITKMLDRFRNPFLTDEVTRVGRSPLRKLSPNDRLVRPALQAYELGIDTDHLTMIMAAALKFNYTEDPEATELQKAIMELGISKAITKYKSIPEDHPVHHKIVTHYNAMK
ncbi:Mannitol-1-phosphate 5-dehydrogenase [Paenibacillus sediminis]|uniref:Mannitol-1-phosphate 5-dehydrogenase n=1 Tax=Paenibacillus sediminis TaxID=664909 RepID=A0ABS4H4L0_9BACL|nr:mannitol-1-phosphate 5-dehydrogenase [Paenibacillus sediminis]